MKIENTNIELNEMDIENLKLELNVSKIISVSCEENIYKIMFPSLDKTYEILIKRVAEYDLDDLKYILGREL